MRKSESHEFCGGSFLFFGHACVRRRAERVGRAVQV